MEIMQHEKMEMLRENQRMKNLIERFMRTHLNEKLGKLSDEEMLEIDRELQPQIDDKLKCKEIAKIIGRHS